ncbi:MAG: phosphoglycerate mutase family protein [Bacteroidia bacterium]|nr:phosphoglycerate mutase family protein [Bacteroidia bacterium]
MARAFYIRHAQASYLAEDYDQLSDLGYQQSKILGEYLIEKEILFDRIYVGPLKRHHQTFEKVLQVYDREGVTLPEPEYMDELVEHQGPETLRVLKEQLVKKYPHLAQFARNSNSDVKKNELRIFTYFMEKWATDALGIDHPPHLQKWSEFKSIVHSGIQKITGPENKGKNVACFTSGGTISATIGYALGMNDDAKMIGINGIIRNTSINEFLFSDEQMSLLTMNRTPHLSNELTTFV